MSKIRPELFIPYLIIVLDQLCRRSRLANVSNRLSNEMIEMAAKLLILWNSPGVVLDPAVHPRLDFFNDLLCTSVKLLRIQIRIQMTDYIESFSTP